jgi:hypothetical protein
MITPQKRTAKISKIIAILLICIIALSAEECNTKWLDDVATILLTTGAALLGIDNPNIQIAGAGAIIVGTIIDTFRQDAEDYDPGIRDDLIKIIGQVQGAVQGITTESENRQAELQARRDEMIAEDERYWQEVAASFEAYERSLSIGTSSVTSATGEQNIGNPQINNLATSNGTVITASPGSRSQGTGAQRTGTSGGIVFRPQQTTRDDVSANPNAANSTESRRDGAPDSLSYTEQQPTVSNQQQPTAPSQQQTPQTTPATVARVATVPQPTPQTQSATIADFTPARQQPASNQAQTVSPRQTQDNNTVQTNSGTNNLPAVAPVYYYSISTGVFRSEPAESWPVCYSGGGAASKRPFIIEHQNNLDSVTISDYGPIPPGTWTIIRYEQTYKSFGTYVIFLEPATGVTARKDFLIHGDNAATMGQSSDGCIIMNQPRGGPQYRKKIADAFDMFGRLTLYVTP